MKRYIFLKNARIADVKSASFKDSDILIRQKSKNGNSEIIAIGENIELPSGSDVMLQTVNLHGQIVCPSFVDMRCDICEPGNRNRESFETLGASAAAGGFGAVVSLPLTGLSASEEMIIDYINQNEHRTGGVKILPTVSLTLGASPSEINDLDTLKSRGAVAFYDDGSADIPTMLHAMRLCAEKDILIVMHCEEKSLVGNGVINYGEISRACGLEGIPACAEEISVARNVLLAAETGCRLHISHISTARSAEIIRNAKKAGVRVTCDTAPQYFSLIENDLFYLGSKAKVDPPLRSEKDRNAIIDAIVDQTIDCICSDHSPKSEWEKPQDMCKALDGMIGLQSAFTVALSNLAMNRSIDIFRLISMFTTSVREIIGYGFEIKVGKQAYLNVISLDDCTVFQMDNLKSNSKNSAFLGESLRGALTYSIIDGVLISNPDVYTL